MAATLLVAMEYAEASTVERKPWTCQQLESATDAFYRMFPAYLGSSLTKSIGGGNQPSQLERLQGHCFMDIKIATELDYEDGDEVLKAKVTIDLAKSLGFCMEHLQISTAFSDYYNFYVWSGAKEINLKYEDAWEIADILQNGLRYFTYCADPFTLLESSVTTAFMWLGGTGTSKYLPALGQKPTMYQKETNGRFLEQYSGAKLEERIINIVDVDQRLMKTGDILIGRRISGDSASWMMLEGGVANHAAMIVADESNSNLKYVIDCPAVSEQNLLHAQSGARKTELNEWLGNALA